MTDQMTDQITERMSFRADFGALWGNKKRRGNGLGVLNDVKSLFDQYLIKI
jgi:hypothetical protein